MNDVLGMAFGLLKRFLRATGSRPDGNWFDRWIWPPIALSVLTASVCSVLAFLLFAFVLINPYSSSPFPERAILSTFDGESNPLQNPNLEIECRGFDCDEVIPHLPAATGANCVSDFLPVGACCPTRFGDVTGSEVHIWWKGFGKYRITLTAPMCRNPEFDPSAAPGTPEADELVRCDELWRSRTPSGSVSPDRVSGNTRGRSQIVPAGSSRP